MTGYLHCRPILPFFNVQYNGHLLLILKYVLLPTKALPSDQSTRLAPCSPFIEAHTALAALVLPGSYSATHQQYRRPPAFLVAGPGSFGIRCPTLRVLSGLCCLPGLNFGLTSFSSLTNHGLILSFPCPPVCGSSNELRLSTT